MEITFDCTEKKQCRYIGGTYHYDEEKNFQNIEISYCYIEQTLCKNNISCVLLSATRTAVKLCMDDEYPATMWTLPVSGAASVTALDFEIVGGTGHVCLEWKMESGKQYLVKSISLYSCFPCWFNAFHLDTMYDMCLRCLFLFPFRTLIPVHSPRY